MRLTRVLLAAVKKSRKLPENYHNLPERFVRKQTAFVSIYPPKMMNYNQEEIKRWKEPEDAYYDVHRPWEKQVRVT